MPFDFTKAERVSLKGHPEFTEKSVQEWIIEDPSILGFGDVELVAAEKVQPKAGRLDLLLHDEQLNRRYEVELMLGATDPSHIIRCIEYWDIERRRYPAYDHVAVLAAEDITSRFLNVISLLAGSIPLIAIQIAALNVDGKIALHFVHVLDQTSLRTDDEYELGDAASGPAITDRQYWDQRTSPQITQLCDQVQKLVDSASASGHTLVYKKRLIGVVPQDGGEQRIWIQPKKTVIRIGAYVANPEEWVKRFDDLGQTASLKRGNKAVLVTFSPENVRTQQPLLQEFMRAAYGIDETTAGQLGERSKR